jgi:tRNA nucleotidyltransferase/poly(A) polymerase
MANLADQLSHPVFATISEVSGKLGLETYVVGGFVRDLILKRPCKDIDFVCVGSGISLAEAAAKAINPRINVSVFKNFGTAHFHYEDYDLEFVGARRESYNRDSRKPVVEEGTLSDDSE